MVKNMLMAEDYMGAGTRAPGQHDLLYAPNAMVPTSIEELFDRTPRYIEGPLLGHFYGDEMSKVAVQELGTIKSRIAIRPVLTALASS